MRRGSAGSRAGWAAARRWWSRTWASTTSATTARCASTRSIPGATLERSAQSMGWRSRVADDLADTPDAHGRGAAPDPRGARPRGRLHAADPDQSGPTRTILPRPRRTTGWASERVDDGHHLAHGLRACRHDPHARPSLSRIRSRLARTPGRPDHPGRPGRPRRPPGTGRAQRAVRAARVTLRGARRRGAPHRGSRPAGRVRRRAHRRAICHCPTTSGPACSMPACWRRRDRRSHRPRPSTDAVPCAALGPARYRRDAHAGPPVAAAARTVP